MKNKLNILSALLIVFVSCGGNPEAVKYYNIGLEKINEKPAETDTAARNKIIHTNLETALNNFDQAIKIDTGYADAYAKRGLVKRALGDYDGCLKDGEKVISLKPKSADAYYFIGQSKYYHKDYQGAIKAFAQLITIEPKVTNVYYLKATSEKELNRNSDALKDYNSALEFSSTDNPFNKFIYTNRGLVKVALNDANGGCLDFHKALQLGDDAAQTFIDIHCK